MVPRRLLGLEICGRTQWFEHSLHHVEREMWQADAARLRARRRWIGGMPAVFSRPLTTPVLRYEVHNGKYGARVPLNRTST